jgi:spore coat protein CotF
MEVKRMQNQGQQQKIQNPKTEVANTPQLNDRDYCDMMLNVCKKMVLSYATALNETSNDTNYEQVFKIFQETSQSQRKLYNLMFSKGWYSIEAEQPQKIQQAVQQYSGYKPQIQ